MSPYKHQLIGFAASLLLCEQKADQRYLLWHRPSVTCCLHLSFHSRSASTFLCAVVKRLLVKQWADNNNSVQVAAVEALTAVVEAQLVAAGDIVDLLLPTVLSSINVAGSPDEVDSHTELVCHCVPCIFPACENL